MNNYRLCILIECHSRPRLDKVNDVFTGKYSLPEPSPLFSHVAGGAGGDDGDDGGGAGGDGDGRYKILLLI